MPTILMSRKDLKISIKMIRIFLSAKRKTETAMSREGYNQPMLSETSI